VTDTSNLRIFIDAGRWPEAVPLQRIEVQRCLSRKGIANDLTLTKMKSLGWLCRRAAFFDEATSILRDAARLANESKLHKLHIRIQVEEAKLKLAQGFYRASEAQCKEILTLQKLHLTPDLYFEVEVAAIILENVVLSGRISKDVVEDILKQYQNCGNLGSGSYPLRDIALAVGKAMARDGCEAAAVKYFKQALEAQELVRPANHPETLLAACLLGFSLTDTGSKEGLELVQSAYVGLEQVIGPKHPWTLLAMHCVGWANIHLGTVDVAVGYLERSFQGSREVLGLSHSQTILTVGVLCHLLLGKGQTTKALKILRPIIAEDSQSLCEDVFNLAAFTNIAGEVFTKSNRKDKARDLYTRFIAEKGNLCQKDFFQLSKMYHALGEICFEEQNYAEAILYFEYAFEGRRNIYGAKGEDTLASMRKLGICYRKNFNEAMAQEFFLHIHTLRTKMLESAENTSGKESPSTLQAVHNLGIAWRDRRHFRSARSTFHRASTGRKKALGATHPLTKESERMEAVSLRDSDPIVRWIKESIFSSGQEY
jgi:tetratricopeptide (TPR) repeat protein